jgi:glycosyltransferase involved in cell wall biosynthesis
MKNFLSRKKSELTSFLRLLRTEQLIRRSDLFDGDYYRGRYNLNPNANIIRHYLIEGTVAGYCPNKWFDTDWYRNNYEDVANSGANPFVHYIQYGRNEGRATNRIQYHSQEINGLGVDKEHLPQLLWRGLAEPCLTRLKEIYSNLLLDESVRFFAIWHSARWFYYSGEYKKALSLSQLAIAEIAPNIYGKSGVLMHALCLQKNGKLAESEAFIRNHYKNSNFDEDILLALSNCAGSADEKFSILNQIYRRHGLKGLTLKSHDEELSFKNLATEREEGECISTECVSVIVPCFNAGKTIKTALESLLSQSWRNLEIIVVDDCSEDNTVSVIESLSEEFSQIKLLKQPQNGGAYRARNAGLLVAKGAFITTHDADDWSHPQKIQLQMEYLSRNEAVMGVCTQWVRATPTLNIEHNWRLNPRLIHWSHSSFLFRRVVFDELGYWDSVLVGGDTEYIWRVESHFGFHSVKKIHSDVPLAFALDDENSLTRNKATHIKTMYQGMRHIYRQACQWWHLKEPSNLYMGIGDERKFPAPPTMISKKLYHLEGDVVFVADFCEGRLATELYEVIASTMDDGRQVFLYHLPQPRKIQGQLASTFFELLSSDNAEACVFGMTLSVDCVCFLDPALLLEMQEERATLISNKAVIYSRKEQTPNIDMALKIVTANETVEVKTRDSVDSLLACLKDKKS